jgi:hypothetical protein
MVSVAGSTLPSYVRIRRSAPSERGGRSFGLEHWSAGVPCPARCHVGACGISQVSWRPSMPLPCSKTPAEPTGPRLSRSCRCCPRVTQAEGFNWYVISGLTQGFSIRCLASRATSPPPVQDSLPAGGLRLYRRGRTLWIASKGFRLHLHSPFQDFSCRKGRLCEAALRRTGTGSRLCRAVYTPCCHLQQPASVDGRQRHSSRAILLHFALLSRSVRLWRIASQGARASLRCRHLAAS